MPTKTNMSAKSAQPAKQRQQTDPNRPTYVADTNVLMGAGRQFFNSFTNSTIVIPLAVINELRSYDGRDDGIRRSCSAIMSYIEELRAANPGQISQSEGIVTNNGNSIRIGRYGDDKGDGSRAVVKVARDLVANEGIEHVTVLSNSLPVRINADTVPNVTGESFRGFFRPFTGWLDIPTGDINPVELADADVDEMIANNICYYQGQISHNNDIVNASRADEADPITNAALRLYDNDSNEDFRLLRRGKTQQINCEVHAGQIRPRENNLEQVITLNYLMDDQIKLVFLGGRAGAGKTLLSLAAGIAQNKHFPGRYNCQYQSVKVFRSVIEMAGQKTGFLPGSLEDKLQPWAQPIWDDVEQIDSVNNWKPSAGKKSADGATISLTDRYADILTVDTVAFLRGRTLNNTFIIVDDAQSLDGSTILSIISRCGEGTKIVFTYDMNQQDNVRISRGTSILSIASAAATRPDAAQLDFTYSERSELAQWASSLLENGF